MGGRVSGQWMGGDGHKVYCFRMGQRHPSVPLRMRSFGGGGKSHYKSFRSPFLGELGQIDSTNYRKQAPGLGGAFETVGYSGVLCSGCRGGVGSVH